jgi:hypothetical protein
MPSYAQSMLALRVALGTLWGAVLFIAGLSIAARHASTFKDAELVRMAGVGLTALGLYAFSAIVGDRLFPRAEPRLCGAVQLLLGAVGVAGVICGFIVYLRWKFAAG